MIWNIFGSRLGIAAAAGIAFAALSAVTAEPAQAGHDGLKIRYTYHSGSSGVSVSYSSGYHYPRYVTYPTYTYASSTYPRYTYTSYTTSTPTFTYASSTYPRYTYTSYTTSTPTFTHTTYYSTPAYRPYYPVYKPPCRRYRPIYTGHHGRRGNGHYGRHGRHGSYGRYGHHGRRRGHGGSGGHGGHGGHRR